MMKTILLAAVLAEMHVSRPATAGELSANDGRRETRHVFLHPGIGLNRAQLDRLKANVQNGVEPWKSLYGELTRHNHRFSKTPRIFTRRGEGITKIDSPDFDNRCAWDSITAYCQAVMYEITGEDDYRERALEYVRWFYTHITSGHSHWDSQFRWPDDARQARSRQGWREPFRRVHSAAHRHRMAEDARLLTGATFASIVAFRHPHIRGWKLTMGG